MTSLRGARCLSPVSLTQGRRACARVFELECALHKQMLFIFNNLDEIKAGMFITLTSSTKFGGFVNILKDGN